MEQQYKTETRYDGNNQPYDVRIPISSNIISTNDLNPQSPIKLADMPQPDVTGLLGTTQGAVDYTKSISDRANLAEAEGESSKKDITRLMESLVGKTADIQAANEASGLNATTKQLNELNAQAQSLFREAQAIPLQIQEQFKNTGATERGVAPHETSALRQNAIKALSIAQQTDIATANYVAAKDKAQQIIDLKYKPIEDLLAIKKQQYEFNKDTLERIDKKRTEALNIALKKEERDLVNAKAIENKIQDLKLEVAKNGAPASILNELANVKTLDEALTLSSGYLKDPLDIELKKVQIAKAWNDAKKSDINSGNLSEAQLKQIDTSPQGKKLTILSSLYQKMQTYKNLVDSFGFRAGGKEKSLIDSAYADLKISWKEAANLGALTGPDVSIIEEAIKPSSGGAINYLNYRLSGGKGGISSSIENSLKTAKNEALNNYKQLISRRPEYAGSDYVRGLITPFAKDYSTVDINNVLKGEIIQTEDGILLESLGDGNFTPL